MLYYHKAPHRNWMPAQRHLGINDDRVFPEPFNLLDDYSGRGSAARGQAMEIGRDMWPEWDLKLMTPEQLAQSYVLETSATPTRTTCRVPTTGAAASCSTRRPTTA